MPRDIASERKRHLILLHFSLSGTTISVNGHASVWNLHGDKRMAICCCQKQLTDFVKVHIVSRCSVIEQKSTAAEAGCALVALQGFWNQRGTWTELSCQRLSSGVLECADSTRRHFTLKWLRCSSVGGSRQEDRKHLVNRNPWEQWSVWSHLTGPVPSAVTCLSESSGVMDVWGKASSRDKHQSPSVASPLLCLSEGGGDCWRGVDQQAGRNPERAACCVQSLSSIFRKRGGGHQRAPTGNPNRANFLSLSWWLAW